MYTRELRYPPEHFVKNGKPLFGSFDGIPETLDIKGVKKPFSALPLPACFTNLRIRSNICVIFQFREYIGAVYLLDNKIFGISETMLWNTKTGIKYKYRNIMGLRRRLIPKNLVSAVCVTFSKRRRIRIRWERATQNLSLRLKMKGDSARPDVSCSFTANLGNGGSCFSTCRPAPIMRRCAASAQMFAPMCGSTAIAARRRKNKNPQTQTSTQSAQNESAETNSGLIFFDIRRAYYKLRIWNEDLTALGMIDGKPAAFRLSVTSYDAADSSIYNENVLFFNGETTPLPPVTITHPFGITGKWIIQDTESMVDLSFTPLSCDVHNLSIFILKTKQHTLFGMFNGILLTKSKHSLVLKDFRGIVQKNRMRL